VLQAITASLIGLRPGNFSYWKNIDAKNHPRLRAGVIFFEISRLGTKGI
jgi:hypothetical protein